VRTVHDDYKVPGVERGSAASQCGKACLSENSIKIFRGYASNRRHSLQKDSDVFPGKASLTDCGAASRTTRL
jgi:hypothetical protein